MAQTGVNVTYIGIRASRECPLPGPRPSPPL